MTLTKSNIPERADVIKGRNGGKLKPRSERKKYEKLLEVYLQKNGKDADTDKGHNKDDC